ncbi:MAG: hypothetical protein PSN04_00275 [Methyloprofundus sp.]|nr:hypothetical protein [Methyloprofundus sp.]
MIHTDVLVIDTNVAIVANEKSEHASIDCELNCIELLEQCTDLTIALDDIGLIMDEYSKHLSYAGQPGVGDMFFKYLYDNQYANNKITHHTITQIEAENQGFQELPPNNFDPSDRKLLAVAVVADACVVNATDSDWAENIDLLNQLNISVHQLCPEHCSREYT